jgi:hypothetical protein
LRAHTQPPRPPQHRPASRSVSGGEPSEEPPTCSGSEKAPSVLGCRLHLLPFRP